MHNKLNAWTQIGDGVAVHFQIAYLTKNKRWRCATTEHSTPPSFPPVQLSSVQTRQALRAQTITIPKRLIPSVDQSYRFPSEKAESKENLCRHWSGTGSNPPLLIHLYILMIVFSGLRDIKSGTAWCARWKKKKQQKKTISTNCCNVHENTALPLSPVSQEQWPALQLGPGVSFFGAEKSKNGLDWTKSSAAGWELQVLVFPSLWNQVRFGSSLPVRHKTTRSFHFLCLHFHGEPCRGREG